MNKTKNIIRTIFEQQFRLNESPPNNVAMTFLMILIACPINFSIGQIFIDISTFSNNDKLKKNFDISFQFFKYHDVIEFVYRPLKLFFFL